jgi:formylglycine-generating enzyme required for sulfatase activity
MKLCAIFGKFDDLKIRQLSAEIQIDAVTAPSQLYDPHFVYASGDDVRLPAVSMSQYAAKQYTKWLSLLTGEFYRLPTEAEWEYACRAGTTTAFSFGDKHQQLSEHGCFIDNSDDVTSKIGIRKPNAWGLFDMHGNVSEWVLDQYYPDWYVRTKKDVTSSIDMIAWPNKLFPRVVRGGSWDSEAEDCRSAARRQSDDDQWRSYDPNSPQSPWWFASEQGQTVGFRIVRPLNAPPRAKWDKYHDADLEQIRDHVRQRIEDEGRGEWGIVDPDLPAAISKLK